MLYIATEFIGICAPLTLLGVPFWVSSIFAVLIIFWLKEALDNKKIERVTLIIGLLNLAFIAALILAKPDFSAILRVLTLQDFFPNVSPLYLIIIYFCATMGNCIAPFMLIFQSDNSGNTENLKKIRVDLAIGSVIQPIFASLIMSCGAVLYGIHINAGFENLILAFGEKSGQIAMIIFAVGLFNSALLAGVTIAIANASLPKMIFPKINKNIFLLVSLILCAVFVCLKIGHMTTIVLAQIFGACVLIPDIFYLAHLTSKKNIMGKNKNTKFQTFITYLIGISFIFVAIFSLIGAFLA
jgi:Mn2+/Fe2+ NRAMP family transporter